MRLLVGLVLPGNRLLYGTPNAQTVQLASIAIVEALVYLVPWAHIVSKAMQHAHHAKQIVFQAKDRLSVSPAPPD